MPSRKPVSERFDLSSSFDDVVVDPCCNNKPKSMKVLTTSEKADRKVWFDRVIIYEHAYILGDNPSVSDGAPLSIAWKAQSKKSYELEYYESMYPSEKRRRAKHGLKLGVTDRAQLLLSNGYNMTDIVGATLEVLKDKQNREESIKSKKWDGVNAAIENTTRTMKKVARRSSLIATAPVRRMNRRGSLASTTVEIPTATAKDVMKSTKGRRNSLFGTVPLSTISDPVIDGARTA